MSLREIRFLYLNNNNRMNKLDIHILHSRLRNQRLEFDDQLFVDYQS